MVYMVLGETKTYYFRSNLLGDVVGIYKGYDYSKQTIYDIIKRHQTGKSVTDIVIENAFDFLFSFLTYSV